MGLGSRIRSLFAEVSDSVTDKDEPDFVCIKCGMGYGREYQSCRECGSSFVVPNDPDEGAE
jgi:ribosomal protein L40E